MHPNPAFRQPGNARNIAFARERGFGVLSINGEDGPLLAHVPFLIDAEATTLDLHLVRSNPIARALSASHKAAIAVSGPDTYVSPDWYGAVDQVPTWNYVAVHLRGTLSLLPQAAMRDMLDRQSALFEDRLRPKAPWTTGKMTGDVLDRMMRQIVPCRMVIDRIDGTWKLNQNKPDAVRTAAAGHVAQAGVGAGTRAIARLMLDPSQD